MTPALPRTELPIDALTSDDNVTDDETVAVFAAEWVTLCDEDGGIV